MSEESTSASGSPSGVSSVALEQLDTFVRVATIHSWVYLAALFAVCAGAVVFSVVYRVPTKVNGEGILLIDHDALGQIRAQGTGRLLNLRVKIGEEVEPGKVIGEISQSDLMDAIREAELKRDGLVKEDSELSELEQREKETLAQAMARVKRETLQAQLNSEDKLRIARQIVDSYDRLGTKQYVGDSETLEAREKLYEIRDDLNKGRTRVAELDLEGIKAESLRRRGQLERSLKIRQLETKLDLDRNKLARNSQIKSLARGKVVQVLMARGEMVQEGSPLVLLHSPNEEPGTDGGALAFDTIVFVAAGQGKKIGVGDPVEVSPATVKREEHGYILGEVVAISELPATKLGLQSAPPHPELVDAFLKRYAPGVILRVEVKLKERDVVGDAGGGTSSSEIKNRFHWSASSGPKQVVKTGTMCQAAIVVERRRLISLILPWMKTLFGTQ